MLNYELIFPYSFNFDRHFITKCFHMHFIGGIRPCITWQQNHIDSTQTSSVGKIHHENSWHQFQVSLFLVANGIFDFKHTLLYIMLAPLYASFTPLPVYASLHSLTQLYIIMNTHMNNTYDCMEQWLSLMHARYKLTPWSQDQLTEGMPVNCSKDRTILPVDDRG